MTTLKSMHPLVNNTTLLYGYMYSHGAVSVPVFHVIPPELSKTNHTHFKSDDPGCIKCS